MAVRRVHVLISGRVQGVFFRQSAVEEAQRLGIAGWVRNRPDGRVEAEAEGPEQAIDAFVAFCRRGPEQARVEGMVVRERPLQGATHFLLEPTA
jgi:acylphosphatase